MHQRPKAVVERHSTQTYHAYVRAIESVCEPTAYFGVRVALLPLWVEFANRKRWGEAQATQSGSRTTALQN
jgi:hypothetical protein